MARAIIARAPPPISLCDVLEGNGGQAFAREHNAECVDQVGRGVDQRAVEIENEKGRGHANLSYQGCRALARLRPGLGNL
jgi:hypothetical protein